MTESQVEERELTEATTPPSRRWSKKRIAAVLAVVLVVAAVAGGVVWNAKRLPGDAAMRVDGTVVTEAQLRKDVATLRAMYGVEPPQAKAKLAAFWRDAAKASAVTRILDAAAVKSDVVIPGRKVDEALAAYVAALYEGSTDPKQEFIAALASAGTSETAVKEEIRQRLTVDALTQKIVAGVKNPTPEAVADAFEARKCSLVVPETRHLRNIVVATQEDARSISNEVRSGGAFAAVAKLKSADESTRNTGGDLGQVAADQLDEGYAAAAFGTKPGAVFGPVRTESGWNVGQVVKVIPGRNASLTEVAQALQKQLVIEEQSRVWQAWLANQIKSADVTYADEYRPADPNAVPAGIGTWADSQQGSCSPGEVTR